MPRYNHVLLKAIELRTERARLIANRLTNVPGFRYDVYAIGAFTLALVLTLMTFMVLRRTVIQPLQQSVTYRTHRLAI